MKNLIKISLMIIMLLSITTTVNAVTPNEFISYVSGSRTIDGKSVTFVTSEQKVEIERYLKRNSLSETTLDYIKGQFDAVVEIMTKAKVTKYSDLSKEDKQKVKNIVSATSAKTGIKYTINSNGEIEMFNLDGTLFTKFSPNGNIIKQTGNNNYMYIIPLVAIVAVAISVIFKRNLKNDK